MWSLDQGQVGQGVRLATAISLAGMAGGRIVSLAADRATGGAWPWVLFAVESGMATLLLIGNAH